MEVLEAIEKRTSTRQFLPHEVPADTLERILYAGTQAPNAFNSEPWEFIIVKDEKLRARLADMRKKAPEQHKAIETAPVIVVVCYDKKFGDEAVGSTYACIENMLLAATAEGLAGVTLTFHGKKAMDMFGIPDGFDIASIIPMGYPAESPEKPTRVAVRDKMHIDKF
ncbi:MAG: nitroreductase family protein [Methanohalophilus sp.]